MKEEIKLLKIIRNFVIQALEPLSGEQIIFIPKGFNNNILWNAGHILVSQQLLTYGLSGNDLKIPDEYSMLFRKGSSPKDWTITPNVDDLKELLIKTPNIFQEDFDSGLFENFTSYKTSGGTDLETLEDAIAFNNFHEGLHLGIISSIIKLVK